MLLQEKFAKCELRCQIVANRSKGGQLKILVSSNSKEKTPLALALHAELDVICPLEDNDGVLWCASCGDRCGCRWS
jgi:hypothetical protein